MSVEKDFKELVSIAKEFLQAVTGELDLYTSEKGEIVEKGRQVILLTPAHIQYARYGRGPGKNPPFKNILDFVMKEKIQFENLTQEGTAAAIQFSIGKNGTKNWVPNAPSALEEAIQKHLEEYLVELSGGLSVIINDEVNSIYKQIDFKHII